MERVVPLNITIINISDSCCCLKSLVFETASKMAAKNLNNMDFCALYSFDHEQQTNNNLLTPIIVGINVPSCS